MENLEKVLVSLKDSRPVVKIGWTGENQARGIVWDISTWQTMYGDGTCTLLNQRETDTAPYPCTVTVDGKFAVWQVTDADLGTGGNGQCQLIYTVGENVIAKSPVYQTVTGKSLGGLTIVETPDWVLQVIQAGADANVALKAMEELDSVLENIRQAAEQAEKAAETATDAANQVESAKSEAVGTINAAKDSAVQQVDSAGETAVGEVSTACDSAVDAVTSAQATAVEAVGTAKTQAISDAQSEITAAKDTAVQAVNNSQTAAAKAVDSAKTQAVSDVQSAGTTATGAVTTAQTDAVSAVQTAQTNAVQAVTSAGNEQEQRLAALVPDVYTKAESDARYVLKESGTT